MMRNARQDGFTLIEMVLGIAILGMIGLGVMTLLRGAGDSASEAAINTKQAAELRNAMAIIQRDVGQADKPLLAVGDRDATGVYSINSTTAFGGGNEIIFTRSEDRRGSASPEYHAERIFFDDEGTNDGRGSVVLQTRRLTSQEMDMLDPEAVKDDPSTPGDDGAAEAQTFQAQMRDPSVWNDQPQRVLVSKAVISSSEKLFTFYQRAGVPTVNPGRVALVDVNLRRDEDAEKPKFQPATLKTSVFLRNIGTRQTGNGSPINC